MATVDRGTPDSVRLAGLRREYRCRGVWHVTHRAGTAAAYVTATDAGGEPSHLPADDVTSR